MTVTVTALTGESLAAALDDLARLRITVFRDYPYLYAGTLAYERGYMEKFARAEDAVIVVAEVDGRIVGAATASPMVGHADAFAEPFRAAGHDPTRVFYFGESVLEAGYRGRGLGHRFFDAREAHARRQGGYDFTAFCAVVRPDDHPRRPRNYRPLDGFWLKRDYVKQPGMIATLEWTDVDQPRPTAKPMQFWMRRLE